ncbi:hypothetical protein [Flavimaribacter sediminis]|uniref:hypothetical protein n=1 Tax=Flavimaribacter sediminis TaxID=2865987 RepID=UPI00215D6E28|nr:hypothetical protein [Flavimaribacter sediminis]
MARSSISNSVRTSIGRLAAGVFVGATLVAAVPGISKAGDITVYTSYEEDELAAFLEAMKADLPDVNVDVLRLSTGDLRARMLAEADNPKHDVIWGWAATSMVDPRIKEMLEPYSPADIDKVPARFRDRRLLVRHHRVYGRILRQQRRDGKGRSANAVVMAGPHQAGI